MMKFFLIFLLISSCQSFDKNFYMFNNQDSNYINGLNNKDVNQNNILYDLSQKNFQENKFNEALDIIGRINFNILNRNQIQNILVMKSEILLLQNKNKEALYNLKANSSYFNNSYSNLNLRYIDVLSKSLKNNGFILDAMQERIFIDSLLDSENHFNNVQIIWQYALELNKDIPLTGNKELDGYIHLSKIFKDSNSTDNQYAIWLNQYPNHSASYIIFQKKPYLNKNNIRKVAIILPESENMLETSNAIKKGFADYMNDQKDKDIDIPDFTFLKEEDINDLNYFYKQIDGKFDFVLGPLSKKLVRELSMKDDIPIKTLALNYSDREYSLNNLYQYGLKAEDESVMIANKVLEEGINKIAVFMKRSSVGSWNWRVFDSFQQNYRGEVYKFEFKNEYDISNSINQIIQSDAEAIFIIGDLSIATYVKNSLYNLKSYPTWTMSHVNNGVLTNKELEILTDVKFFDIPYVLFKESIFKDAAIERMYAMGQDSAKLILNFQSFLNGQVIDGLTGKLILVKNSVRRILKQAMFTKEKIVISE